MASLCCRRLSFVVCSVSSVNIFKHRSSETTGPIEVKLQVEHPWDGGTKDCSRGPGHMSKMAAMLI